MSAAKVELAAEKGIYGSTRGAKKVQRAQNMAKHTPIPRITTILIPGHFQPLNSSVILTKHTISANIKRNANLAKVEVEGSNPFTRSTNHKKTGHLRVSRFSCLGEKVQKRCRGPVRYPQLPPGNRGHSEESFFCVFLLPGISARMREAHEAHEDEDRPGPC